MNKLLFGLTIGAVIGAAAYRKIENSKTTEKMLQTAQEKLKNN